MPTRNLTARFHAARDLRLAEEPMPVPADGESLVRITAVGLCGSDLHWYEEGGIGDARITHPIVGGHEMAGVVEGGPLDGVRVAVDPAIPCHRCDLCLRGHPNLCRALVFAGHATRDGGLQRYLAWPTARLHPLPETLSDADGAMLEPLGVAVHAVDLGHIPLGGSVAVIGCGPIGLLLIQVARAAGAARVLAADPLAHRRLAATARGADEVLDPADDGVRVPPRRLHRRPGRRRRVRDRRHRPGDRRRDGRGPPRRPRRAGRHPRHRDVRLPGERRPPQGPDDRPGPPHEGGLPAGDGAGRSPAWSTCAAWCRTASRSPRCDDAFKAAVARQGLKVVVEP